MSRQLTFRVLQPATERNDTPPSKYPILVSDCAKAVRAIGGGLHLLQKHEFGFLLRCEFGPKQFRVVIPSITSGATPDVPHESNSPAYVVHDLNGLSEWLRAIKPIPNDTSNKN